MLLNVDLSVPFVSTDINCVMSMSDINCPQFSFSVSTHTARLGAFRMGSQGNDDGNTMRFPGAKIQKPGRLRAVNEIEVLNQLPGIPLVVLYLLRPRQTKIII